MRLYLSMHFGDEAILDYAVDSVNLSPKWYIQTGTTTISLSEESFQALLAERNALLARGPRLPQPPKPERTTNEPS